MQILLPEKLRSTALPMSLKRANVPWQRSTRGHDMGYSNTTQDPELDYIKRQPIDPLLIALGFSLKKETDPKGVNKIPSMVLGSMKLKTFKGSTGHYMWKSHDGSFTGRYGKNAGSIVDVAVHVCGGLAQARQRLRELTGSHAYAPSSYSTPSTGHEAPPHATTSPETSTPLDPVSTEPASPPPPTSDELFASYRAIGFEWTYGDEAPAYLASRHLTDLHPAFNSSFRVSNGRGTVAFQYVRHSETDARYEFAGYEFKNDGYKSYSKGGKAGIWCAGCFPRSNACVVTESPIDAMSYAALLVPHDEVDLSFLALRSGAEDVAIRYLRELIDGGLKEVIIATDNDSAGMLYASKVMAGLRDMSDRVIVRYIAPPFSQVDWSDALAEKVRRDSEKSSPVDLHPAEFDPCAGMGL